MGILDLYTNFNGGQGSAYNYDDVSNTTEPSLLGSTQQSKLHANGIQPGYSLNGSDSSEVTSMNNAYNNGGAITLSNPSNLDLDGAQPTPYSNPETGATYL